ncbi:unnamed protein product [Blepharisma stoltei]|uniref:Uncharacterized protein n=1 Tax=Blepharisma stoltei TaxID=1481888 RepID=A0AAU9KBC5_9CILI|nr:unnamed protein product [Blepharisma stoltei]
MESGLKEAVSIGQLINFLHDPNRNKRKDGLVQLSNILQSESSENVKSLFSSKLKPALIEIFGDSSESNREKVIDLINQLLSQNKINEDDIPHIVQKLHERLGHDPCPETCEEIKVKESVTLKLIATNHWNLLLPSFGYIIDIVCKQGKESSPAIKISIAEIVSILCDSFGDRIGFSSKRIFDSMRNNLYHQQFKVRLQTLTTLGKICICEGALIFEDIIVDFKKLQLDRRKEVREVLYKVIGDIMCKLQYTVLRSFEGKLSYLLLGGFSESEFAWINEVIDNVGYRRKVLAQEFTENVEDYIMSDAGEFLILRNLQELVQLALDDIQEWTMQDHYRSKAASILDYTIRAAQNHITPHLDSIFKVIFKAYAQSEDKAFSALFENCIEKIGMFCDFDLVLTLFRKFCLTDITSPTEKSGGLILFAKMLNSLLLTEDRMKKIVSFIAEKDLSDYPEIPKSLQLVIESLILQAKSLCISHVNSLFHSLLLLENSSAQESVQKTMGILAEYCGLLSVSDLYATQLPTALPLLTRDYRNWDSDSKERSLFKSLIVKSGSAVSQYFDTIVEVMSVNSQREKDSEVRFTMLVILENSLNLSELDNYIRSYCRKILESIIVPTAAWKVGISNVEIRVSSMLCLEKLIGKMLIEDSVLVELWDKVFPVVKTCLDDDWDKDLRISACRVIISFFEFYSHILDEILVSGIYPELLKRLDDSQDYIRMIICVPLEKLFKVILERGIRFGNYKFMIETLLVHLDDPSENIQKSVKNVLQVARLYDAETFLELSRSAQHKHRHPRAVTELIEESQNQS